MDGLAATIVLQLFLVLSSRVVVEIKRQLMAGVVALRYRTRRRRAQYRYRSVTVSTVHLPVCNLAQRELSSPSEFSTVQI